MALHARAVGEGPDHTGSAFSIQRCAFECTKPRGIYESTY